MPEKNRFPAVLQPMPVVIDRAAFNQGENAQYDPHIKEEEQMVTLVAKGPHAVGQPVRSELIHCADTAPTVTSSGPPYSRTGNQRVESEAIAVFAPPMVVRRLTPTECLRLQGFPDGWTQIPWKNRPPEKCPDGPQYKAIGNSWAVPCARWIGERIQITQSIIHEKESQK